MLSNYLVSGKVTSIRLIGTNVQSLSPLEYVEIDLDLGSSINKETQCIDLLHYEK